MARAKHKLTAARVESAKEPRLYADGGGLFLQVTAGSDGAPRKSWLVRYRGANGVREMGLGPLETVSLARARIKAAETRALAADGVDPIAHRDAERARAATEAARAMTFAQCAEAYIAA